MFSKFFIKHYKQSNFLYFFKSLIENTFYDYSPFLVNKITFLNITIAYDFKIGNFLNFKFLILTD